MATALSILGLLCLAFVACLTVDGIRAILGRWSREAAQRPITLVVAERREVAGELLRLKLRHPKGKALAPFGAGQHLLLSAPAGRNGNPIRRAYSLAAWEIVPAIYEFGIKREAQGTMSQWLWANLHAGDSLQVSRPRGDFLVRPNRRPLVLVGGGIGITPMRAMVHQALANGRQTTLVHAARTADLLLYRGELATLAAGAEYFAYLPILSRPDSAWTGLSGRLDAQRLLRLSPDAGAADFYLCAGNALMAMLRKGLIAQGIAADRIHSEAFGAATGAGAAGLNITVDSSGTRKTVQTAGEPTLLATLEDSGIDLPSECRAGSCGQCVVRLDAGEVEWLADPECTVAQGQILPCICAAKTDVSLSVI